MDKTRYPVPEHEERRLARLREYGVLDTLPEQVYDDFVAIASAIFGTPLAQMSLVDADRQWFKARIGIEMEETPREVAFCAHAIVKPGEIMVVNDASKDPRFQANPLVTTDPSIRFYVGAPLVTPDGDAVGTLCVLDRVPREAAPAHLEALRVLARQIVDHLELRRSVEELERLVLSQDARVEELQEARKTLEKHERDLEIQSHTDPLTGIGNRRALEVHLLDEFARVQRFGGSCSVAMVDLDFFKDFNDVFGHLEGDRALVQAASLISSSLRVQDFVARFGGEEFVVVLPGTTLKGAMVIGERIRRTVQRASWPNRPITVSVGVATLDETTPKPDDLLRQADAALYRSKDAGRNRVSGAKAA